MVDFVVSSQIPKRSDTLLQEGRFVVRIDVAVFRYVAQPVR